MKGCKCRECFGLREVMVGLTGRDHGLPQAPGHVVATPKPSCDNTLVCICPDCASRRAQMRPAAVRQPWEPRRTSRAA